MTATELKEQLLKEAGAFDTDAYRDDIRNNAVKYGTKYKEDYEETADNDFGAKKSNKNKTAIILAIVLFVVVAGGGTFYFIKKNKK